MRISTKKHYDLLIEERHDPYCDPPALAEYMDKWDGQPFIDALGLAPEKAVLEFAVGTGRLAKRVLDTGCRHFTGIDFSRKTVERAAENLKSYPNKTLIANDFFKEKFKNQFDIIYSSLTFLHIRRKKAAIRKIFDLLKPGGIFAVSISKDKASILDYGTRKIKMYPDNPGDFKNLLRSVGFQLANYFETDFAYIIIGSKIANEANCINDN